MYIHKSDKGHIRKAAAIGWAAGSLVRGFPSPLEGNGFRVEVGGDNRCVEAMKDAYFV